MVFIEVFRFLSCMGSVSRFNPELKKSVFLSWREETVSRY